MSAKKSGKTTKKRASGVHDAVLLDAAMAAAMCRLCRPTFYKLNASGKTPRPIKLGGILRWDRREMLDWIEADCPDREKWETMRKKGK